MPKLKARHLLKFALGVMSCTLSLALMGANRGAITRLTLDPKAPVVNLFEGIEQAQFEARLVANNANDGKIFITNKTDKPLTVAIPKGLVGVPVLAQFNPAGGFNNGLMGQNGLNGQNGQNGLAQNVGGNAMPGGGQNVPALNGNGAGNGPNLFPGANAGFFSIPPEKTVQIGFHSVCLNFGRREPHAGMKYQLARADSLTSDPLLQQLLEDYSPSSDRQAQQAAAWHLANGLTWERISQLRDERIPGDPAPMFSAQQVQSARQLVEQVKKSAASRPQRKVETPSTVASR